MTPKVNDARMFAAVCHLGQTYGTYPYTYHLQMVHNILESYDYKDENTLAAAWLHDVVEDTDATILDVRGLFGMKVAEIVEAVTDPQRTREEIARYGRLNRKQKKEIVYAKLQVAVPAARAVKLADRLANVRSTADEGQEDLFQMYRKEHPRFKEMLKIGGEHAGLWSALEERLD